MISILIIVLFIFIIIFYVLNNFLYNIEKFCYGNTYCNGNKDKSLCINQKCLNCGLSASCKNDSDCGPNNCINGCCD
jgi:hypothetical protein